MSKSIYDSLYRQNTCTPSIATNPVFDPYQSTGTPCVDAEKWAEAERQRRLLEHVMQGNRDRSFLPTPEIRPKTTLRFKNVVFVVRVEGFVLDFFEDEKDIHPDEMRLLGITYPEEHAKIKEAWMYAWKDLQAVRAFEND